MNLIDKGRSRLAGSVRRILAGKTERQFTMGADNTGLFGPQSVTWTIHADASMLVGGLTALIFQTLHPSAMAAVAQHSDYRSDPLGRLRRTVSFLGTTTYGSREEATAAIDRLIQIHARIAGVTDAGIPYRAADPHLLGWVHATEVFAFLEAHASFGRARLTGGQYDSYVEEMATVGEALGVEGAPRSRAQLQTALESYRPELETTAVSADAVRFLSDFRLGQPARAAYRTMFTAALLLQPWWAQPMHPIRPGRLEAHTVPPATRAIVRTLGWALAYEPPNGSRDGN